MKSYERSFGIVFAVVFLLIGLQPLFAAEGRARLWLLLLAALFLLTGVYMPLCLRPMARLWAKFAELLQRIVQPAILGLMFIAAVLPTGLYLRLRGKDTMRRAQQAKISYWIPRDPAKAARASMRKQF